MKRTRRKTRSDKFPLTLHPTGQYCKKIKGKIRYFGTDKKICTKAEIGRKARHIKPCSRANFQQSDFERGNS